MAKMEPTSRKPATQSRGPSFEANHAAGNEPIARIRCRFYVAKLLLT
jgi:hypothetical protein